MGEKKLIHAVAGSGKTRMIIEDLDPEKRNLIITYTRVNQEILRKRIVGKFGYMPERTFVFGVFEFLYRFCLIPYWDRKLYGIDFNYEKKNNTDQSVYSGKRIISYQISKQLINKGGYISRINKFFDCIYIDECQDFEAYDFDWMKSLYGLDKNIKVWLLGDFYQKTYSTSRFGNKGKGIHENFEKWKNILEGEGFIIDETTLATSYRCPEIICEFIKNNLEINIRGYISDRNAVNIEYINCPEKINTIMGNNTIKKLFYKAASDYLGNCQNWGDSKGSEYDSVCVVLNKKTLDLYNKGKLTELPKQTKNRFYVACTRAKKLLYFIDEAKLSLYKKES